MRHSIIRISYWLLAGLMFLNSANSLCADDAPLSTAEFVDQKDQWSTWIDRPLKVEGRAGSFVGRNQFRLVHCELPFHVSDEQRRTVENARNVELAGRVKKESGKLVFVVDRVKPLASDVEQFTTREAKLKST